MPEVVLDAWAVMAWLKGQQPAASVVRSMFKAAARHESKLVMNIVNLGEVFYLSVKARGNDYGEKVLRTLRGRVTTISVSDDMVLQAAGFKAKHPISYADAFAAATAVSRSSPLLTGDPELRDMAELEAALTLEWIGDSTSC